MLGALQGTRVPEQVAEVEQGWGEEVLKAEEKLQEEVEERGQVKKQVG